MSKKTNTLLFIAAGTVVNLVLAVLLMFVFFLISASITRLTGWNPELLLPFGFLAALILSMIIYRRLVKWVIARFNLADSLGPLIAPRVRRD